VSWAGTVSGMSLGEIVIAVLLAGILLFGTGIIR
jgi:hypothetical protein